MDAQLYTNPANFVTGYDSLNPDYGKVQYQKGLNIGSESHYIFISIYGTWGAMLKNGGMISSYEKIGYHAHTADLLSGFLASGCSIKVCSWEGETVINE